MLFSHERTLRNHVGRLLGIRHQNMKLGCSMAGTAGYSCSGAPLTVFKVMRSMSLRFFSLLEQNNSVAPLMCATKRRA